MAKNKNRMSKEAGFTGFKSQDEVKTVIAQKQKLIDSMKTVNSKQVESQDKATIITLLEEAETLLNEIAQLKGNVFTDYESKRNVLISNEEAQKIIENKDSIINEANVLLEQAKTKARALLIEAGDEASIIKSNAISSAATIADGLKETANVEAKKTISAANELFANMQNDYQESIVNARQESEKIIAQARKTAEEILVKANDSADKIIESAHQSAQNIIDKSNVEIETIRNNIKKEHENLVAKRLSLESTFAEKIKSTKEAYEKKKEQIEVEFLNTENEKRRLEQAKNRYLQLIEAENETIRIQAENMFQKMDADIKASNQLLLNQHKELLKKYNSVCDDKIKLYTLLQSKSTFDLKTQNDVLQDEIRQLKYKISVINNFGINELNAGEFKGAKEEFDALVTSTNFVRNENKKLKAQLAGMTENDELVGILQRENAILTEDNEKYRQRLDAAKSRDEMVSPLRALPSFMNDNSNELEPDMFENEVGWLNHIKKCAKESGIVLNDRMYYAYHTALKTSDWSPLVVLAGVSGTGKSELPRQYAIHGGMQFVSVPVKPDWDSPASLFGYYNSIENKLEATDLLKALYHMQSDDSFKNQMMIVLLDEMNLAHPEQYFADMLSKFESARGTKDGMTTIDIPLGAGEAPLNIKIGRNVLWTGTMNEDETTKGLSDKVVDRSNLITFPQPTELYDRTSCLIKEPEMFLSVKKWKEWKNSALKIDDPILKDEMDQYRKCIASINGQLNHLGRSLGQRVWQSIQYYIVNYPSVIEAAQHKDWERFKGYLKYAFCDAVAFKVMPKLRGIEVKGSNEKYISGIRDILIKDTTPKFVEDFDKARTLTSELFQWCSSDFMSEDEYK